MNTTSRLTTPFTKYAWLTLAYTLLVILWGAYVRASGSGAGCGEHWPLCNGTVLLRSPQHATLIEFSHRVSSGISLILIGILLVWAFRSHPRGHALRHATALAAGFLVLEAGLGAGLVLFALVAKDASAARAVSVAAHLVNTFMLVGSLTYVCWLSTFGHAARFEIQATKGRTLATLGSLVVLVSVGVAGAIVALGDTLFPATSLVEGMRQDLAPTAHFLLRLRVVHPILAVTAALYIVALAAWLRASDNVPRRVAACTHGAVLLVGLQMALGVLNLLLLAPIWLQMLHLFVADALWITLVLLALETLGDTASARGAG